MAGRAQGDIEILVHAAAPSTGKDDAYYRALAVGYMQFESATRIALDDLRGDEAPREVDETVLQGRHETSPPARPGSSSHEPDAPGLASPIALHTTHATRSQLAALISSPRLSFGSAIDNLDSPLLRRLRKQYSTPKGRSNVVISSQEQASFHTPPSVIEDSQSQYCAIPHFSSPTRILELFLQHFNTSGSQSSAISRSVISVASTQQSVSHQEIPSSAPALPPHNPTVATPSRVTAFPSTIRETPETAQQQGSNQLPKLPGHRPIAATPLRLSDRPSTTEGTTEIVLETPLQERSVNFPIVSRENPPLPPDTAEALIAQNQQSEQAQDKENPTSQTPRARQEGHPLHQETPELSSQAHDKGDTRPQGTGSAPTPTPSHPPSQTPNPLKRSSPELCIPGTQPRPSKSPKLSHHLLPPTSSPAPSNGTLPPPPTLTSSGQLPPGSTPDAPQPRQNKRRKITHGPDHAPSPHEIHPPPPSTIPNSDLDQPPSVITPSLLLLSQQLPLAKHYRPKSQSRPLRPLERGYWSVDMSTWGMALRAKVWAALQSYVRERGMAGWGVWCVRCKSTSLAEVQEEAGTEKEAGENGEKNTMDGENGNGNGKGEEEKAAAMFQLRTYCWGEIVGHVYLLVHLVSERKVKGTGAVWVDGGGSVVVRMS